MMITERVRDASFILTELPRTLSRDTVTLEGGHGMLDAGTVLGKISASGKYIASPANGSDGSQVAVAVLVSAALIEARLDRTSAPKIHAA
ncbi:hypothetical protein ABIE88_006262 [Bradyrhizobium diazoefficiens]|uniref:head decoration protein n=1 Tax=Bradyrhizobium diazoefficiens TaxID=1355477 RepID=UPI003512F730